MDWNWNTELNRHSITADPEVLRVLYERLQQRNAENKKVAERIDSDIMGSYYTGQTWREAVTLDDAQWLISLGISPL